MNLESIINCIKNKLPSPEIDKMAISIFEKGTFLNEIYYSGKYIYLFCNVEGSYDHKILIKFEELINNGLSYNKNKEIYLDVLSVLSELCFKYKLYKQANNYLLLLRDIGEYENLPIWVFNYSAKIIFMNDIKDALYNPDTIIKLLTKKCSLDKNSQGVSILKEFILCLIDSVENLDKQNSLNFELFFGLQNVIKPYIHLIAKEWNLLLETIINHCRIHNKKQSQFYEFLFDLNTINQLLEEKNKEYERLYNKYIELEDRYQSLMSQSYLPEEDRSYFKEKIKILVLGASSLKKEYIFGIAKEFGLSKDQLDLFLDYDKNRRFQIEKLRYNSPYSGILIGPVAHCVTGLGDYNSVIEKLRNEEGYPPFREIKTFSGELKITKTAFKEALEQLLTSIKGNIQVF